METLTYKYLSERDMRDATILYNAGSYAAACRLFQQSAEKILKHYIHIKGVVEDAEILTSHSNIRLYDRVAELGGLMTDKDDRKIMSVLKNYYYDLNYPGANSREVDKNEAEEIKQFMESFLIKIK